MDILRLDLNIFVKEIKKSIQEDMPDGNTDFVTDTVLNSERSFVLACKKFAKKRHCPVILKEKTVILNLQKK